MGLRGVILRLGRRRWGMDWCGMGRVGREGSIPAPCVYSVALG